MRKEFKINSVETVSEESQKSNVKIVTFVFRQSKLEHSRTSPDVQFALTKQKLELERTISELGKPFPKKKQFKKI